MVSIEEIDYCRHLRCSHVLKQVLFNFDVAVVVADVADVDGGAGYRRIQQPVEVVLVCICGIQDAKQGRGLGQQQQGAAAAMHDHHIKNQAPKQHLK
jgi:hypothetical protein